MPHCQYFQFYTGPCMSYFILFLLFRLCQTDTSEWDLADDFLKYFVSGRDDVKQRCIRDQKCPFTEESFTEELCLGYEHGCPFDRSYSSLHQKCDKNIKVGSSYESVQFWKEADFGYVKQRSILHEICASDESGSGTVLQCSDHLRHCFAKNIYFDFKNLNLPSSKRYREDVIQPGMVGGNCAKFSPTVLKDNLEHLGYLQSWAHELRYFESSSSFVVDSNNCDIIFERPTVIMKLDASVNMYHHFCDFINLFASQLINGTFNKDIDIVWWDTHPNGFVDPFFGDTWKAFSTRKPVELSALDGKRVCFKNALLPMLARQRFGLFYNTPLSSRGCSGTGLFHAFSHHILQRLGIKQDGPILDTVRVTLLVRSTAYRKILNQPEIVRALQELPGIKVNVVDYNSKVAFLDQLHSTHNSDVFLGVHGSGLTHLLFLPDWAAVFEIYNCDDVNCYKDLARLRGLKYWTWKPEKSHLIDIVGKAQAPSGSENRKFANFNFDVDELVRIVKQMVEHVRRHPKFVEAQRKLRRKLRQSGEL